MRPLKIINPAQVSALASIGCPVADIAKVLDCSTKTLERRFMKEMDQGRAERNASLRRKQFELAMAGNTTMLIWLGKQYLGQKDKHELSSEDGSALQPPSLIVNFVDVGPRAHVIRTTCAKNQNALELTNG
jgi:hypothetical protein